MSASFLSQLDGNRKSFHQSQNRNLIVIATGEESRNQIPASMKRERPTQQSVDYQLDLLPYTLLLLLICIYFFVVCAPVESRTTNKQNQRDAL